MSTVSTGLDDEIANGWRAEVGYIWDIGKPRGFHMGVSGAYDDSGKLKGRANPFFSIPATDLEIEGKAFAVYFFGEQQLARWCHFVFKVGPTLVSSDLESSAVTSLYTASDRETDAGFGAPGRIDHSGLRAAMTRRGRGKKRLVQNGMHFVEPTVLTFARRNKKGSPRVNGHRRATSGGQDE